MSLSTPQFASTIDSVLNLAKQKASHSWEYGTVSQAILDWHTPELSIWSNPFPNGQLPTLDVKNTEALSYMRNGVDAEGKLWIRVDGDTLIQDGKPASYAHNCNSKYMDELLIV
jgi:hypothetical protein